MIELKDRWKARRAGELRARAHMTVAAHLSGFMELLLQPRDRHPCGCGDKTRREKAPRPDLDAHKWRQSRETVRYFSPNRGWDGKKAIGGKNPAGSIFSLKEGREEGREAPGAER